VAISVSTALTLCFSLLCYCLGLGCLPGLCSPARRRSRKQDRLLLSSLLRDAPLLLLQKKQILLKSSLVRMGALTTSPRTVQLFSLEADDFCGIWTWFSAFDVKKEYLSSRLPCLRRGLGLLSDSFLHDSECSCYVKFQPNVKLCQSTSKEETAFSKYSEPLGKGTFSKYDSKECL